MAEVGSGWRVTRPDISERSRSIRPGRTAPCSYIFPFPGGGRLILAARRFLSRFVCITPGEFCILGLRSACWFARCKLRGSFFGHFFSFFHPEWSENVILCYNLPAVLSKSCEAWRISDLPTVVVTLHILAVFTEGKVIRRTHREAGDENGGELFHPRRVKQVNPRRWFNYSWL